MAATTTDTASGGFTSLFDDRKIGTKILIGFGCVLVILATVAAVAYLRFGTVAHGFETFAQRVAVVGIARDVDREFVELRRHVRAYWTSGAEASLAGAKTARTKLKQELDRGLAEIKNPERLAKFKEIARAVETYGASFDAVVPLKREQIEVAAKVLDPTGQQIRKVLDDLRRENMTEGDGLGANLLADATLAAMQMRLDVNKMLGRHDEAAIATAERSLGEVKALVPVIDQTIGRSADRKLLGQLRPLTDSYGQGFHRARDLSKQIEQLVAVDMAKLADTIARDAEAIKASGIAEERAIEHETKALVTSTEQFSLWMGVVGVVLGVLIAWLIGRAISKPTQRIGDVLRALADGNKTVEVPYTHRGDEVGDNARAAATFKENLLRLEAMEAEQKAVEMRAAADRKAAMRKLADDFEAAVGHVVTTVSAASNELEAAATTLTHTAENTQRLSTAVAAASEQASTNVQSVASATNEMSSSVDEIGRQVHESARIANDAVKQAEKTDARITELSQAASRIGDVVKLITAIAEQTNLLALNATIEAARAGEAGKGFAVVAQEVKALAAQTGKATGDISAQISSMQAATTDSVAAIKEIGGTIGRIAEIAASIAASVEQQEAATREIARNVQQASQGTTQVASNITDVSRGAGETGSASSQVLSAAKEMSSESAMLKLEVDKFLHNVRAA